MRVRSYLLIVFGLLFVLAYQNCSRPQEVKFSDSSASKAASNTDENGRPYDGKVYVLGGDLCPDGTAVRARIVLKTSTSADLERENCAEITPVALSASDFEVDASRPSELIYKCQTFVNQLVGTKLDVAPFVNDGGFAWFLIIDFPTPPDVVQGTNVSTLQLYEDGKPLGPGHSFHADIRNLGAGRFSHWQAASGVSTLRFSTSDNTDPHTNGRTYTWTVK